MTKNERQGQCPICGSIGYLEGHRVYGGPVDGRL